jgi:hypothetical protein
MESFLFAVKNPPSLSSTQIGDSGRIPMVGKGLKKFTM